MSFSEDIQDNKKLFRKRVKSIKSQYSIREFTGMSDCIFQTFENNALFRQSKTIVCYWAMDDEVQTAAFIERWFMKKSVLLPSLIQEQIVLKPYRGKNNLIPGPIYGIPEPDSEVFTDTDSIDLILVPGVAFDVRNNRLGRGKAYYDRLLSEVKAIKAGVCFDFQLFDSIPVDQHDIPMDIVFTEKRITEPTNQKR